MGIKLYVIGNGFDLHHRLNTKFIDFRDFLRENYEDFLMSFEEAYSSFAIPNLKDGLWSNFEENLCYIDDETLQSEIINYDLELETEDIDVYDTLLRHYNNIFDFMTPLQQYIKEWAERTQCKLENNLSNTKSCILDTIKNDNSFYITFNYTLLLERLYNIDGNKVFHIHGSINKNDIDPIVGHGHNFESHQFFRMEEKSLEQKDFRNAIYHGTLRKYYSTTLKDTSYCCSRLVNKLKEIENVERIIVIGSSIGNVDLCYFMEINYYFRMVPWQVYYYSDEELNRLKMSLFHVGVPIETIEWIRY